MKQYQEIDLINTAAIKRDEPTAQSGTLYETVRTEEAYVDLCLKRYLGRIVKCETVEELDQVRDGVTPDCYSYSNYMFRHLREADYTTRACIGTKVSKEKLQELTDEVFRLEKEYQESIHLRDSLKRAMGFEKLGMDPGAAGSIVQGSRTAGRCGKRAGSTGRGAAGTEKWNPHVRTDDKAGRTSGAGESD